MIGARRISTAGKTVSAHALYRKHIHAHHDPELAKINNFIASGYSESINEAINRVSIKTDTRASSLLQELLAKHKVNNTSALIRDILDCPAFQSTSSKSARRGNKFNACVFDLINTLIEPYGTRFKCEQEVQVAYLSERLDFVLTDSKTGHKVLGYNQLDLWGGGHQLNRADKYILSRDIHEKLPGNTRLLCVVNNFVIVKSTNNKVYRVFKQGIQDQTLAYPNHLDPIIIGLASQ